MIHYYRAFDIMMMAMVGGRQREEQDWYDLFKKADKRFKVTLAKPIHTRGALELMRELSRQFGRAEKKVLQLITFPHTVPDAAVIRSAWLFSFLLLFLFWLSKTEVMAELCWSLFSWSSTAFILLPLRY